MASRFPAGFQSLEQLRGEVDRLFGGALGNVMTGRLPTAGKAFPAINLWEEESELLAEAEVPGLKAEDLDIAVVGNSLSIKGRRPDQATDGAAYHRRERGAGDFARVISLPVDVDADQVSASLHDGVLLIRLPKAAAARPRKIQVNV